MKEYRIRLRGLIEERGLTITQVSRDTGLSRVTLTGLFYPRKKGVQIKTMNVLCNYFRITPGELFIEVKPVYPIKK